MRRVEVAPTVAVGAICGHGSGPISRTGRLSRGDAFRSTTTCAATVFQVERASSLLGWRAPSSQAAISARSNLMNHPTFK